MNLSRNIKLFILFRLFFNVRFYYPVFAVMFLDFGLTMEQFALTNVVWAVTIVLLEVPSGALADIIGRKALVVLASCFMVMELLLIAFVPLTNTTVVFWAIMLNRILSGAAEALASGADEALAYDSLPEKERASNWPRILEILGHCMAGGFFISMTVGSLMYDPEWMNKLFNFLGINTNLTAEETLRIPIYATLVMSVFACLSAILMRESLTVDTNEKTPVKKGKLLYSIQQIGDATLWTLRNPLVLTIILFGLWHESFVRLFYTWASEYFRIIHLPEASYGLIGSATALIGIVASSMGRWLINKNSLKTNFPIVSGIIILSFIGMSFATPWWGVLWVIPIRIGFNLVSFFMSHYLNAEVDSKRRATVLSFKGLALNLGFGGISLMYGVLLAALRTTTEEAKIYPTSLVWLPWIFSVGVVIFYIVSARICRASK